MRKKIEEYHRRVKHYIETYCGGYAAQKIQEIYDNIMGGENEEENNTRTKEEGEGLREKERD